jgi:hypothetical protein
MWFDSAALANARRDGFVNPSVHVRDKQPRTLAGRQLAVDLAHAHRTARHQNDLVLYSTNDLLLVM